MIQAILLAAGNSSRFGSNKLLHPLPDGTPLAGAAARNLQAAVPHVLAIVRPEDHLLAKLFAAEGVDVLPCPTAVEGMGASLACGIRATDSAQGWIVALADMPFIQTATIAAIRQALEAGAQLAAPVFNGQRGHPVGFGRHFLPALASLTGDQGARDIVAAHWANSELIACHDPGILADIDHADDLLRHKELMGV